jgi:hypothetical protein
VEEDLFRADFGSEGAAGPPNAGNVVQLRDIVLCTTGGEVDASHDEFLAHPPVGIEGSELHLPNAVGSVDLGRGVVLTALDDEEAETLMNACEPRGHYYRPHRQFSQRYAFVCERQPGGWAGPNGASFSSNLLGNALTLSRLVRDNGNSMQYAARIATFRNGSTCIVPLYEAEWKTAYRARSDRDWLDGCEAEELAVLLADYWALRLPERVDRALWRSEEGVGMQFLEPMVPFLTGGLEALLKTERHGSTKQFTERVPALAAEVGVAGVDAALCEDIYAVDADRAERYPDGTVLIPADSPDAIVLLSRAIGGRRPVALVYPGGREIIAAPRGGPVAFFKRLLTQHPTPRGGQPTVPLPADYRVEIRSPQTLAT